jgi:hypothetical protein
VSCCPVPAYRPNVWDPHRQAEPIRVQYATGVTRGGQGVTVTWRGRGQRADEHGEVLLRRIGARILESGKLL